MPRSDLRPVLKSLILSLLPALEEETSEDFERALRVLEALEQTFSRSNEDYRTGTDGDGYFWQCLFLSVITSPSRRQGSLNFLVQRLPKFCSANKEGYHGASSPPNEGSRLSPAAEAVVSPEPGLLIRCFACGLSDPQILIQRGFLDLLVSHLPLDSPLLQSRVRTDDLDRLMSAAAQVLLRREMSLNRRLWSWLLGPESKPNGTDSQPSSPTLERKLSANVKADWHFKYFSTYGRKALERCMLAMFTRTSMNPTQRARPFRICLSLMDRWEIGGSIIPHILLPGLENAFQYSRTASTEDTAEVMRSASLFFDGVEATLIWEKLLTLLKDAFMQETNDNALDLFIWIIRRFNINDEEMLTVHMPYVTIYLLSLLQEPRSLNITQNKRDSLFGVALMLLEKIPERALADRTVESSLVHESPPTSISTEDIRYDIEHFYHDREQPADKKRPIDAHAKAMTLCHLVTALALRALDRDLDGTFSWSVSFILTLHQKMPSSVYFRQNELFMALVQALTAKTKEGSVVTFPAISSSISLATIFSFAQHQGTDITTAEVLDLEPAIIAQIWHHLSPSLPKYHVEAAKGIWQFQDLLSQEHGIRASLTSLVRDGLRHRSLSAYDRLETCKRFAILWNHTVPAPSTNRPAPQGFVRRSSAMSSVLDTKIALQRQSILIDPLMLILDVLNDFTDPAADAIEDWLHSLTSLGTVLDILFDSLSRLTKSREEPSVAEDKFITRSGVGEIRELEYTLEHFLNILRHGNEWVWQCLVDSQPSAFEELGASGGAEILTECCMRFACTEHTSQKLEAKSIELLNVLLSNAPPAGLKTLDLDSRLIDRLMVSLSATQATLQGPLLKLIYKSLKLRLVSQAADPNTDPSRTGTVAVKRTASTVVPSSPNASTTSIATPPPSQLLNCIRTGFSSTAARAHLDQWLSFLASILPIFANAIFASVIPLVECLRAELDKSFDDLLSISKTGDVLNIVAPEATVMTLLEALDLVLARAHDVLLQDNGVELVPKAAPPSRTLLGSMTSGVFKSEVPQSKTTLANSRLTVILTFQDAIRVSMKLWTWASRSTEIEAFDRTSAATTSFNAVRIRNRTRSLLEQLFVTETLESLEAAISNWCHTSEPEQAVATLDLLHVMRGMRPKTIVPTILDSLCSRLNPAVLPAPRESSQTVDLSALDIVLFLLAYVRSTEDDAMDEIWADCIAFLKDVLSNPLPFRQILPILLSLIYLLAQKADNTNFGEQRKMRRELGDVFLRLLTATFTAMPSGYVLDRRSLDLSTLR